MGDEASIVRDNPEHILIIKLGALGDVIQALGPMRAIREHHSKAHITCMTTAPFRDLINQSGYCDSIWEHSRPSNVDLLGWMALRKQFKLHAVDRVYDLQTSSRSNRLYKLLWPGPYPEWSGNAAGCSLPHKNPARDTMHTVERQAEQLRDAGIPYTPQPSLEGLGDSISHLDLPSTYCLVVPGGAAHRPDKRWPTASYRELMGHLTSIGITPIIVGTKSETDLAHEISDHLDGVVNLVDRTSLLELIKLTKGAQFAIGNDSGPMHIASVAGIPSIVLYSHASDPKLCAQRGSSVKILRKPSLDELSVDEVISALPSRNP